jgi:DNA-binding NarL/FixJ family response regulator
MAAPRIVLVDDHALCRNGLSDLLRLRGGMDVVAALSDPDEVIRLLREHKPDLVVLDLRMPATDGLTLLRRMRAEGIDTPALILTMSDSETDLSAALRAGVRGYLLKDMEPEDVIAAIGQRRARRADRGAGHDAEAGAAAARAATAATTPRPAGIADRTRTPDPGTPGARRKQQDHRARAGHQPRHRQAARAAHPVQAQPQLARGSRGVCGGSTRRGVR